MRLYVVCPFVRLSVTFRYHDHIGVGWNTSKIISRPNSLKHLLTLAPTWAIWCNESTPKLGWNRGEVRSTVKPAISPKRCKIRPRSLWRTNRKSHMRFRLVPNSTTLDDLERLKRHSCRNEIVLRSPPEKFVTRLISLAAKCRPMILVSKKILKSFLKISLVSNYRVN